MTRSVFKIIVEDNISHHKYIGYSLEKNKNNIDIFVNYVLSNLEMRDGLDKNYKLISGRDLTSYDTESNISIPKVKKHKVIRDNLNHKEILSHMYKELIFNDGYAEMEGYSETKNPILPPIFIDSFISDFDKITKFTDYWRNQNMSRQDNKIFLETLSESGNEVEKYQNSFDFEKALKFYKKLNSAALELADSEKLSAQFVLKQVKIYFHLEQYEKCKDLIETNMRKIEQFKLKDELGEIYYYLGMISLFMKRSKEADDYFAKSSRMLTNSPENAQIHYISRIRRFIIKKDYEHALTLANKAIREFFNNSDNKVLTFLYGIKAEIYIRNEKYNLALEALENQLEYAQESKDIILESKCIAQIFQTESFVGKIKESEIDERLKRIKKLSSIIQKYSYYYNALIGMAIYFYKNKKENEAEKYFKKALTVFTINVTDTTSHVLNMIYLAKIRIKRKSYLSAIRLLNRMLKLCINSNESVYPAYIENLLGKIYSERKIYAEANIHLKRALKYVKDESINDQILIASTYKFLGSNYSGMGIKNLALKNFKSSLKILNKIKNNNNPDVFDAINDIMSKINEIKL